MGFPEPASVIEVINDKTDQAGCCGGDSGRQSRYEAYLDHEYVTLLPTNLSISIYRSLYIYLFPSLYLCISLPLYLSYVIFP